MLKKNQVTIHTDGTTRSIPLGWVPMSQLSLDMATENRRVGRLAKSGFHIQSVEFAAQSLVVVHVDGTVTITQWFEEN